MTFDKLFQGDGNVGDFVFDGRAAAVFDDMLDRSIPFYREIQRMVVELGAQFIEKGGGTVYDIGCSTGNTLLGFMEAMPADCSTTFVGVEPSAPMRDKCAERLAASGRAEAVELWAQPIEDLDCLPDASVIVMLYTLQFVRPLHRNAVLAMCFESLRPGGCLLLGEKILSDSSTLSRLYIERYRESSSATVTAARRLPASVRRWRTFSYPIGTLRTAPCSPKPASNPSIRFFAGTTSPSISLSRRGADR